MTIGEATSGEKRSTPGKRIEKEAPKEEEPPPPPGDVPDAKKLDEYLVNADKWKDRLAKRHTVTVFSSAEDLGKKCRADLQRLLTSGIEPDPRNAVPLDEVPSDITVPVADAENLPEIPVRFVPAQNNGGRFEPYARDPETLARNWAIPGTKGLQHRIGGLEKQDITGDISYDADNHQHMTNVRAAKVAGIANDIPDATCIGDLSGDVLILGWGSTRGPITGAIRRLQAQGKSVTACFLRHLNPFPNNLSDLFKSFKKILIPEMNCGQLAMLIRSKYLVDAISYSKVQGLPFYTEEVMERVDQLLEELNR